MFADSEINLHWEKLCWQLPHLTPHTDKSCGPMSPVKDNYNCMMVVLIMLDWRETFKQTMQKILSGVAGRKYNLSLYFYL